MKIRTVALPVAAIGALALVISGCSGGGSERRHPPIPTPKWSSGPSPASEQQDSVDRYLEKMPDANIKLSEVGSTTETATALTAALAGGKVPDLVMIQNDDLPKFVENTGQLHRPAHARWR